MNKFAPWAGGAHARARLLVLAAVFSLHLCPAIANQSAVPNSGEALASMVVLSSLGTDDAIKSLDATVIGKHGDTVILASRISGLTDAYVRVSLKLKSTTVFVRPNSSTCLSLESLHQELSARGIFPVRVDSVALHPAGSKGPLTYTAAAKNAPGSLELTYTSNCLASASISKPSKK